MYYISQSQPIAAHKQTLLDLIAAGNPYLYSSVSVGGVIHKNSTRPETAQHLYDLFFDQSGTIRAASSITYSLVWDWLDDGYSAIAIFAQANANGDAVLSTSATFDYDIATTDPATTDLFALLGFGPVQPIDDTTPTNPSTPTEPTMPTTSEPTYGPGIIHSVTVAAALRAQIDQTTGWHKSLSNIAITGPTGISQPISWDLEDPDTDAGYLNSHDVTTLINHNGLRFWGNRNCSDDPRYAFEVYTRTAQTILQTIIDGCFPFIDQPLTPTLGRDILDSINAKLAEFVSQGRLIGAKARYDDAANTTQLLSQGQFWVVYDYTPVPTLENLGLNQRITDSYLIDFAQLIAQAG